MNIENKLGACICIFRRASLKRATSCFLLLSSMVANAQQSQQTYILYPTTAVDQRSEVFGISGQIYFYLFLIALMMASFLVVYLIRTKKRDRKNIRQLNLRITQLLTDFRQKNDSSSKSALSDKNAEMLLKKLKALEEEELFLQPNYTLNLVAKKLKTNSSYLSETVNKYLDMTFVEYSNQLRINSIVTKLNHQKRYRNYTIGALAQEAGYKSVNSFNYHFKKILKVTPTQYLKSLSTEIKN